MRGFLYHLWIASDTGRLRSYMLSVPLHQQSFCRSRCGIQDSPRCISCLHMPSHGLEAGIMRCCRELNDSGSVIIPTQRRHLFAFGSAMVFGALSHGDELATPHLTNATLRARSPLSLFPIFNFPSQHVEHLPRNTLGWFPTPFARSKGSSSLRA